MTREICRQLVARGWHPVVVWEGEMSKAVRDYFADVPDVEFRILPAQAGLRPAHWSPLRKLIRETRPEVFVYAFNGILRLFPWIARLNGVKRIIYYDHSSRQIGFVPRPFPVWKRFVYRFLTSPIDKVTAVAGYTGKCLAILGLYSAAKTITIHNGVETERVKEPDAGNHFREKFRIPANRLLVIQVSWLVPEKGVDIFIKAAAAVLSGCPEAHFAVIGAGPGLAEYQEMAKTLGLADRMLFTELMRPTAEGVFEAANVYCQLSQWEEACPLAVQEAMASGLPVIASRVGGLPELVADTETGYLVDRQDHAAAARRIMELLINPELRERMSRASLAHAREHFNLSRNMSRLLDEWGISNRR